MKLWRVKRHFMGGPLSRSAPPSCMSRRHLCPSRIPPGLAAIIQRCLAKEPALRYQRASEVQAALEAIQSASAAPTTSERSARSAHHRPSRNQTSPGQERGHSVTRRHHERSFLLRSSAQRARWDVAGPYFHGQATYALAYDSREGRHRLWASTFSMLWGTFLRSSDDYGRTWTNPQEAPIRFPADSGATLKNIWQICLGRPEEPNVHLLRRRAGGALRIP